MPDMWVLRLSDAFERCQGDIELAVKVLNINDKRNRPILEKSHALRSYSVFVAKVRESVKSGNALEVAISEATRYCIAHNYLEDYFRQKQEEEVFDMLNFAWNQERALEVRAEEARADGRQEGLTASICNVMHSMNFSVEKAMDVLQIPAAEREKYAALVKD